MKNSRSCACLVLLISLMGWSQNTDEDSLNSEQDLKAHLDAHKKLNGINNTDIKSFNINFNDLDGSTLFINREYNDLEKGEFFSLTIDSINTYRYNVEIKNKDIETTVALPSNLLSIIDLGNLESSLDNLNSVSQIVKKYVSDTTAQLNSLIDNMKENPFGIRPTDDLKEYFERQKSDYRDAFDELQITLEEIDGMFLKAQDFHNVMLASETGSFGDVPSREQIESLLAQYVDHKTNISSRLNEITLEHATVLTIIEVNKNVIKNDPQLKTTSEEIKKVHTVIISSLNDIKAQLSAENYARFSKGLIGILNNSDFKYTSLPIQRYDDVNELTITITPRGKDDRLNTYSTVLRIPDIEKSFWGVSTGFYITKNLEQNFSIVEQEVEGQVFYDFVEENQNKNELGINTMVRYGVRLGKIKSIPTFWHFGFGVGLTINEKVKPRLMAGTGLAFGRKNKLFIDIGAVHMYYDKLSNAYNLEGNTVLPENFLVNATQTRGYISLGYLIQLDK